MRYLVRRLIVGSIAVFMTIATFGVGHSASAAGNYYFYNFMGATGVICFGTPQGLILSAGTVTRVANLPAGYVDFTFRTNSPHGIAGLPANPYQGTATLNALSANSGIAFGLAETMAAPAPVYISVTIAVRQLNAKPMLNFNGKPITSTITITCANPGAAPTISVQSDSSTGPYFIASSPYAPANFVIRTITCTTAVFNMPGGTPVGSSQISSGQSWFVSPTAVNDSNGKQWTPVFVAGWNYGYIPTSCAFQNQSVKSGPPPTEPSRTYFPPPTGGPDFVSPSVAGL